MNQQDVPVFWDGGYWYVVPTVSPRPNHYAPESAPDRWCATYGVVGGDHYALLRSPDVWLNAPPVPVTSEQVLQAAKSGGYEQPDLSGKPGMRIGGL